MKGASPWKGLTWRGPDEGCAIASSGLLLVPCCPMHLLPLESAFGFRNAFVGIGEAKGKREILGRGEGSDGELGLETGDADQEVEEKAHFRVGIGPGGFAGGHGAVCFEVESAVRELDGGNAGRGNA